MKTRLHTEIELTVNLPLELVVKKLQEHVVKQSLKGMFSRKGFTGEVFTNSFNIYRNINYRNPALPCLKGKLIPAENSTKIFISMSPKRVTFTLLKTWIIGFTFAWLYMLYIAGLFSFGILILTVVFGIGIHWVYSGFWSEVEKSTETLKNIFNQ